MQQEVKAEMQTITPKKFDATIGEKQGSIIWTAAAIGRRIGRSEGYVRKTLARLDGSPVHRQRGGNFYAVETELLAFLEKRLA